MPDNGATIKPTELQELVTDLEKRIEHLQEWNGTTYRKLVRTRETLAFMCAKFESMDGMYDTLHEKITDYLYSCDEHKAGELEKLENFIG